MWFELKLYCRRVDGTRLDRFSIGRRTNAAFAIQIRNGEHSKFRFDLREYGF